MNSEYDRLQTVRIYLANLTEFDLVNSFHLHGDFFRYYPTGSGDAFEYTDTVMLCQGQRGIVEIALAGYVLVKLMAALRRRLLAWHPEATAPSTV